MNTYPGCENVVIAGNQRLLAAKELGWEEVPVIMDILGFGTDDLPSGRLATTFVQEIEHAGWHLAQTLVWVKNGFVPGWADYHYLSLVGGSAASAGVELRHACLLYR